MAERILTAGERQMVLSVFGASIDVDVIRISDLQQTLPVIQQVPIAPTGNKVYWPAGMAGYPTSPDYSQMQPELQARFLHEITHIWNYGDSALN